jgi:hypothetical protein
MRHLQSIYYRPQPAKRSPRPSREGRPTTPFELSGRPKLCWGCGQSFPVRQGRMEAQVGSDGRLYCFDMTPECTILAVQPDAVDSAA